MKHHSRQGAEGWNESPPHIEKVTLRRALLGPVLAVGALAGVTNALGYYGERGRLLEMQDEERAEAAARSVDACNRTPSDWKSYLIGNEGVCLAALQYDTRAAVSDVTEQ